MEYGEKREDLAFFAGMMNHAIPENPIN